MFNIIETPRSYFTHNLLHDNLSSDVALHFNISHWRPYLVVSYSEEVFCRPSTAHVGPGPGLGPLQSNIACFGVGTFFAPDLVYV